MDARALLVAALVPATVGGTVVGADAKLRARAAGSTKAPPTHAVSASSQGLSIVDRDAEPEDIDVDLQTTTNGVVKYAVSSSRALAIGTGCSGSAANHRALCVRSAAAVDVKLGDGADRLEVSGSFPDRLEVSAGGGTDVIDGGSGGGRLSGEDGGDRLTVSDGVNQLSGGDGEDKLEGGRANDTLIGGADDDLLVDDAGVNEFLGGTGDDELTGDDGTDTMSGGDGRDKLRSGDLDDVLNGGDGRDSVDGGRGDDRLLGGDDDDALIDRDGANRFDGGDGDDELEGGNAVDTMHGGLGDDALQDDSPSNQLTGDAGDDRLQGNGDLEGGDGNDEMTGTFGDLDGGDGNDQISGSGTLHGGAGNDLMQLRTTGDLFGDGGNDTIHGGPNSDLIDGGSGDDVIDDGDDIDAAARTAITNAGCNPPAGHPDRLLGGSGDDELLAGLGDDVLEGGPGDDLLGDGPAELTAADTPLQPPSCARTSDREVPFGDEVLIGGTGNDRLRVQRDDALDHFEGGAGADRIIWVGRPQSPSSLGPGVVRAIGAYPEEVGVDLMRSIEQYEGTAADDRIAVDASVTARLTVAGGSGRDELTGGAGDDVVVGKAGETQANADELIDCGPGAGDLAILDLSDPDPIGCENLDRSAIRERPHVRLGVSRPLTLRSGRVIVPVSCPRKVRHPCRGRLAIATSAKRLRRAPVTRYRVRAGRRAKVRVRPGAGVRRRGSVVVRSLEKGDVKGIKTTLRVARIGGGQ
jgi:Ca2+-binding RTX toxin-like protein